MNPTLEIIGVPSSWALPAPGAEKSPDALRRAGLADWLAAAGADVVDIGDVPVPAPGWASDPGGRVDLEAVAAMAAAVRDAVGAALLRRRVPVVIGGECCMGIGVAAALARRAGPSPTIAWFDAHGDLNTPATSPSGLIAGMPLAVALGHGDPLLVGVRGEAPPAARACLIGARDLDPGEERHVTQWGIDRLDVADIRGGRTVETAAAPFYLHFDVDVLDPCFAPGVYYPVPGGLTIDEARASVRGLAATGRLAAFGLASLRLARDRGGATVASVRSVIEALAEGLAAGLVAASLSKVR